jgi:hypothetical protein
MQELNEGNIYNMEDVFGANLNASSMGIKKFDKEIKSQLFDYLKRNNVQNPEEVIKKTFGDLVEFVNAEIDTEMVNLGVGDAIGTQLDPANKTGAGSVVVTNPKGQSSKGPQNSLGMGFQLPVNILQNLQQFVSTYHGLENDEGESAKFEKERQENNPNEQDTLITWQKMNGAVSNYLNQNLKATLQKYGAYLPDEYYQQTGSAPPNTYHYDPFSRQVYRIGKFKEQQINK